MNNTQLTLDGYYIEAALEAKREGLAAVEAAQVTSLDEYVVFDAIGFYTAGSLVTANTLRDELDAADVPANVRAPLMKAACKAGILEAVMRTTVTGQMVHESVPSTGKSAKGAHVKLYRRTATAWVPRQMAEVA